MVSKSIRQMSEAERKHNSLSAKMFHTILMFSVVLSAAAIGFGFYLYVRSTNEHYSSTAFNIASTSEVLFTEEDGNRYADKVLRIYETADSRNKADDPDQPEYLALYDNVESDLYVRIRESMKLIKEYNEVSSIYVAAYDTKTDRLVYIIDSDYGTPTYRPPGYWEKVSAAESSQYNKVLYKPFVSEKTEKYGYILSSWNVITADQRYIVMSFTDIDLNKVAAESREFFWQYCLILLVLTIAIDILIVQKMKRNVVVPITQLNQAARNYIAGSDSDLAEASYFEDCTVHTGDELESLSLIFTEMEKDIHSSIRRIEEVTSENERIGTELNIASQIQEGMLPSIFPPFPERTEFDIFAAMYTAKEVGGDFYDFFMIDDDHLAMIIADVSGKGIPAALFMMASNILIRNICSLGEPDPAAILASVNNYIIDNNPVEMFVTVWLGILEISTGVIKAANAGHEYPCLMRKDGHFEMLKDKHGLVIGGMREAEYTSYEIQMYPGDAIYVYTDGVTEATDSRNEMFGKDRMLAALNMEPEECIQKLCTNVKESIDEFVLDAPQFDDITMLGLRYYGETVNMNELTIEASIQNVPAVTDFVNEKLEALNCPAKTQAQIDIAIDELFSNIANYAYMPDTGPATVSVEVEKDPMAVIITFVDHGKPYDPLQQKDPDVSAPPEERPEGGLGVFLVKQIMDNVVYEYKDGKNILKIKKSFKNSARSAAQ